MKERRKRKMTTTIFKEFQLDMGHRIPNHKSKCFNIHGHSFVYKVYVEDKIINTKGSSSEGMIIDFGDLKEIVLDTIDKQFDHSFTIYVFDPISVEWASNPLYQKMKINVVDFIPTAENLAKHWFELLKPKLAEKKIKLKKIKIWETPTSCAIYEEDKNE